VISGANTTCDRDSEKGGSLLKPHYIRCSHFKVDDVSALEASSNRSVRIVEDNFTASLHQQRTPWPWLRPIAIGPYIIQAKTWDVFWLAAGYQEHSVNNYKCVTDTHIILVRVIRSIQNSCIKYSTQNLKCSLTLTILIIIWISIILLFRFNWDFIYSAIIHVSDVSDGIFACWVQHRLSMKHPEFALSVAVVDTRRVLRARETTVRGVYSTGGAALKGLNPSTFGWVISYPEPQVLNGKPNSFNKKGRGSCGKKETKV
jgi:hypothetical protein